ncbi:MAG: hypothetical protein O2945_22640 [Planctomycetota bacterium]|nr:hypothetical protein [Planctomycetota bacterium]MDA0921874.1 hypothetical protein [Planctomycetota bacterium]
MARVRFLKNASHLIVDTDTEVVMLPPKSLNLNAYLERWFRSLKSECLTRMTTGSENAIIDCRERLGGMLKYEHRPAA